MMLLVLLPVCLRSVSLILPGVSLQAVHVWMALEQDTS